MAKKMIFCIKCGKMSAIKWGFYSGIHKKLKISKDRLNQNATSRLQRFKCTNFECKKTFHFADQTINKKSHNKKYIKEVDLEMRLIEKQKEKLIPGIKILKKINDKKSMLRQRRSILHGIIEKEQNVQEQVENLPEEYQKLIKNGGKIGIVRKYDHFLDYVIEFFPKEWHILKN